MLMVMGCPVEMGGIWYMQKGYTHASALQGWTHGTSTTPAEIKGISANGQCQLSLTEGSSFA